MKTRNFFTGPAVVLAVVTSSGAVQAPEENPLLIDP